MAELRIEVLERRNNFSLFKSRIASRGSFNIVNSKRKVRIDPSVAKNINKPQDLEQYRQGSSIVLPTMSGKEIRLTQLYKDAKFVGRTQDTTAAEDAEIKQIRKKLEQIKAETGSDTVTLQVGANSYKVSAIESTPGRPKSDFNFVTEDGNRVGFVSHKDGSAPTAIQQWGGISERGEPKLASHPETKAFVDTCREKFPDGIPPGTTVARKIQDKSLKMMAVYGNSYGGATNVQNVDLLLQGTVRVSPAGPGKYKLSASAQTHNNGEELVGGNEPVFMAIYKGDRNNYGVKGARMVISAKGGRNIREYI